MRVSGVSPYIRECFDYRVHKDSDAKVECLTYVRIKEKPTPWWGSVTDHTTRMKR